MDPGKLNKRMTFLLPPGGTDADGFPQTEWTPGKDVWAKVETENGRGFFGANAEMHANKAVFTCRYFKGLQRDWRIAYDGRQFQIEDAVNENGAGRYYVILCEEVPSGS